MTRHRGFAIVSVAGALAALAPSAASARDICHGWATEFVTDAQTCVSSVLPPQYGFNYGPDNLQGDGFAWCEGVAGHGIGESITVRLNLRLRFQRIYLINGYAKSDAAFYGNGRIRSLAVETEDGIVTSLELEDHPREQAMRLPRAAFAGWIRFSIASVYPGGKYTDTCLSKLIVDIEEFNR